MTKRYACIYFPSIFLYFSAFSIPRNSLSTIKNYFSQSEQPIFRGKYLGYLYILIQVSISSRSTQAELEKSSKFSDALKSSRAFRFQRSVGYSFSPSQSALVLKINSTNRVRPPIEIEFLSISIFYSHLNETKNKINLNFNFNQRIKIQWTVQSNKIQRKND